jgi:hypothetical protein
MPVGILTSPSFRRRPESSGVESVAAAGLTAFQWRSETTGWHRNWMTRHSAVEKRFRPAPE